MIHIKNEHRFTGELIDEYSYRYDSNSNIIEEIKREPYKKKVSLLDIDVVPETNNNIRVTKQNFTYDDENKLTDARVERLGMKDLSEANVTTYHYEYDPNGNRTTVEIKDDGLTLESTVYTYDRLNKLVSSREVTASGLYLYEYTYDDNGNLIKEDRHRAYELNTNQWTNIRRYEYTKDNKLASVYSGNTLLVSYTYDGDGTITSSLERDLDLNQNLNIHDTNYLNSLTNNQRQLINKVPTNDSFLYELTEYVTDKNRPYSETLMERDGTGQLSTVYTYGNQRINSESYNNLTGLYTYDGRGSVSAVIGGYGDFRASYWYDGLGNVKSHIHGYGVFGSGKKYYGYNGEQYNPVTGNQNLRNRQVNIRRQRFLTEDTYLGNKTDTLSINRYIYAEDNPLKYKDPSGYISNPLEPIGNAINSAGNVVVDGVQAVGGAVASGANYVGRFARKEIAKSIIGSLKNKIREIGIIKGIAENSFLNDREFQNSAIGFLNDVFGDYYRKYTPIAQSNVEDLLNAASSFNNGGGGVAQVMTFLGEKVFDPLLLDFLEPYANYLQECSDMYADDTYKGIDTWSKILGENLFKTFEDDSGNDIIVTNKITLQGEFGYTKWYDKVFHRYTKSDNDQIDIGNGYKIWIWKGDYLNFGAGGEIGIYNMNGGNGDIVSTTMREDLGIKMTMKIIDKATGNDVVNRSTPSEEWWMTGWNPYVQGLSDKNLMLTGTIDFSNDERTQAMYNSLKQTIKNQRDVKSKIEILDNYKISISW